MRKLSRIILSSLMLVGVGASIVGCDASANKEYVAGTPVKFGLICLHDEQSTYDKNFLDALDVAVKNLGDRINPATIIKTGVSESEEAYRAAKELVKKGCNVIFADSFGHEAHILEAAKEFPNVTFCHATGTQAKIANVSNYHNAFASIYEGRYLAGYAAGLRLQRMVEAKELKAENYDTNGNIKIGYVGAFGYAEVVSGMTSWYLGVKEVVPNVVMDVTYTKSWYDLVGEQNSAELLINRGCALISQHADSMGAPGACESANVPNVSYNVSTLADCPKTYTSFSKINWAPYYEAVVNSLYEGKAIEGEVNNNFTGSAKTGSVVYDLANASDKAAVQAVEAELNAGTRKVFDCSKFTVTVVPAEGDNFGLNPNAKVDENGHLTSYIADVDDFGDYISETEVIKTSGGITYFDESTFRSAPYFDIRIDGITELNSGY